MKRVAIGFVVGVFLAVAGFTVDNLVGVVALIIIGVTVATVAIILQNKAEHDEKALQLRLYRTLNQHGR
jgi:hypothetical protein